MDLKGIFLVIVLAQSSVIAEEEPNRHRMNMNRLLVSIKDAVRMQELRDELVSERQALKKEHEVSMALRSLKNAAHAANRQAIQARAAPARNNSEDVTAVRDDKDPEVQKLEVKTHSSLQKTKNDETLISKGMTKDIKKNNGELEQKIVKESEDKKGDGEMTIDKQSSLVIDKNPAAGDPEDPVAMANENAAAGLTYHIINFVAMAAFTFVLVF